MKGFIDEFKAFAIKGNVVDLAVAVVIGTAFGKIVSSLVANIIMPTIGILLGGIDFSTMSFTVRDSVITYGVFIQSIIDFFIVALVIFLTIKAINHVETLTKKPEEKKEEKPAEVPEDIKLLREIRDELRHTH
jgi:large conductance mechanosensitive channel